MPSGPSLSSSDVAATGWPCPAAAPAPPPPPPPAPPPWLTELLPPPLGASSKYWSPSVAPGGTVILAAATAGTDRETRKTASKTSILPPRVELPSCMALPYRGIGAPVRNRVEAGLASLRAHPADVAIWLGAAGLVVYLSLRAGGYDPIPRDQIGIIAAWVLLVGVAVGALSLDRLGAPAIAVLALFAALVAWT